LGLANAGQREEELRRLEEFQVRREAIEAASRHLDMLANDAEIPAEVVARLRAYHQRRLALNKIRSNDSEEHRRHVAHADRLELLLIADERDLINEKYRLAGLKDETRRRLERELDLRDAQLASVRNDDSWE
jgi:CPA1 family monovalent cation:H+ antiporter